MKYEDYIKTSILKNNEFGIRSVSNFEHVRSMPLIREEYSQIAGFLLAKNIEAIKTMPLDSRRTSEYLAILMFTDQNESKYIVTAYDSDELTQDPQVIDIFKL